MADKKDFKELIRAVKFTLVSASAGIIQVGLQLLLYGLLKWTYWIAYLISLIASVVWNFTINRRITFRAAGNVTRAMLLVLAFYAVFTPVSTVLGELCERSGVDGFIVFAVTLLLNFVLEYLYTRLLVYRNSCDSVDKTES